MPKIINIVNFSITQLWRMNLFIWVVYFEGFKHEQTLTGFKWMGNKADELRKAGKNVILAWEESIGFMAGHPLDKDGITAAGVFAEMASYLNSQNLTLSKQLFNIYKQSVLSLYSHCCFVWKNFLELILLFLLKCYTHFGHLFAIKRL